MTFLHKKKLEIAHFFVRQKISLCFKQYRNPVK